MNKKSNILYSTVIQSILLVLSLTAAILFRASRSNWVFINKTVGLESFCVILLSLMALTVVLHGAFLTAKLYRKVEDSLFAKKSNRIVHITGWITMGSRSVLHPRENRCSNCWPD